MNRGNAGNGDYFFEIPDGHKIDVSGMVYVPPQPDKYKVEIHPFYGKIHVRPEEAGCNHDLKTYVGFSESYKYCTKCEHKENL